MRKTYLVATLLGATGPSLPPSADSYDVIIRHGIVVDGTGLPRYVADIGISGGRIAAIGDLSASRAATELDATGLMVAPGFINVHSHAVPQALPTAENMLTQGVTTELLNADGGGPVDIGPQLTAVEQGGLAVNIAASIGFNSIWQSVVGPSNRRPTDAEIGTMQRLIQNGLERGAYGVSAGLDYKPAYFATTDEVVRILEPAGRWRTFFPNHDRSTPEAGYSSRAGLTETITIGRRAGLVPEITHMKIQGHEQGTAGPVIAMLEHETATGTWVAADVYPYLAGQTGLAALIIPAWAQDGGIDSLRARLKVPALRAKIITESDAAIRARFNGPESIMVSGTRKLSDIMREQNLPTAGAAVAKILDTESPMAILGFGIEADLIKILQYPSAAIACDCGAVLQNRGHPRYYGTFPRVLGHYVRELRALTFEDAVRKMSGLPASLMGLADRGLLATGMAADIAVFDSATVIDHATFERPNELSTGIQHVLVNGVIALRNGVPTGQRGGVALRRMPNLPSRPLTLGEPRKVSATGSLASSGDVAPTGIALEISQGPTARRAEGRLRLVGARDDVLLESVDLGVLQTTARWATVTGRARVSDTPALLPFTLVVEGADPWLDGHPTTISISVAGRATLAGRLSAGATIEPATSGH
jgi:N-acyl-D-aspartate/D-glutamate deacylase